MTKPRAPKKTGATLTKPSPSHASRARARLFVQSPVHEVIDPICDLIATGTPQASAAAMHGVSAEALRGRANEDAEIAAKLARALARSEATDLAKLDALIEEGKPTAGLTWKMERLHRRNWNIPTLVQSESRVLVTDVPASADALQVAADAARKAEDEAAKSRAVEAKLAAANAKVRDA